ncbi:MAG: hypothetical protein OXE87_04825 [Chloroflexi bacterium]|nr:hypothetical protein [Chloroflexota bacterium]
MAAVSAQYINLTPIIIIGLFMYIVAPVLACVVAGALRIGWKGARRGALCGVLTMMVGGCGVVTEITGSSLIILVIQALATTGVGAVVTYWVAGRKFWDN